MWQTENYHRKLMYSSTVSTVILKKKKKKTGSSALTKAARLNNGFSTPSSGIYIFASWIIHVPHTCHTLFNMTYIQQKNHPTLGLKGNDQAASHAGKVHRSIELLHVGLYTIFQSMKLEKEQQRKESTGGIITRRLRQRLRSQRGRAPDECRPLRPRGD